MEIVPQYENNIYRKMILHFTHYFRVRINGNIARVKWYYKEHEVIVSSHKQIGKKNRICHTVLSHVGFRGDFIKKIPLTFETPFRNLFPPVKEKAESEWYRPGKFIFIYWMILIGYERLYLGLTCNCLNYWHFTLPPNLPKKQLEHLQ